MGGGIAAYKSCELLRRFQASDHDALEPFSTAMLWFVIPFTAVWLIVLATYELGVIRGRRQVRRHLVPDE